MDPRAGRLNVVRTASTLLGLLLLGAGLCGYDWRLAASVCGGFLLAVSVFDALPRRAPK